MIGSYDLNLTAFRGYVCKYHRLAYVILVLLNFSHFSRWIVHLVHFNEYHDIYCLLNYLVNYLFHPRIYLIFGQFFLQPRLSPFSRNRLLLFNQLKMGVNFEELSKQFSQSIIKFGLENVHLSELKLGQLNVRQKIQLNIKHTIQIKISTRI